MRNLNPRFQPRPETPFLELQLRLEDGSPWRLTLSPGIDRFIGYYPRVEGLDSGGALLRFRTVGSA